MPVTYIDLSRAAGEGTRARATAGGRLSAPGTPAGRRSPAGVSKPALAQVAIDPAVDDVGRPPTSGRRRRRRGPAGGRRGYRRQVVPQRAQAQPARRSRARHAEGAVERAIRVGDALKIRDAVTREERRGLRLGVHVDEDHRRSARGHRRPSGGDVGHHLLAQRAAEVPQEDEQQRATRRRAPRACRRWRSVSSSSAEVRGWARDMIAGCDGVDQECTPVGQMTDGLPSASGQLDVPAHTHAIAINA